MGEPRQKISVAEAARELNIDVRTLRSWMRKGKINLGMVLPPAECDSYHSYCIYRDELEAFKKRNLVNSQEAMREGRVG